MAVKIRLRRMGAKKAPYYRIVVADSRYPRDGRFIEEIGFYNPMVEPAEVKVDAEKAKKWIANGAQPTDMEELLISIARGLVEQPDEVRVDTDEPAEDGTIVYHLHVAENDMGRVIGKQGRIAKAIRLVMRAAATKNNCRVSVEID